MVKVSILENLMVDVLKNNKQSLNLEEIVYKIKEIDPSLLCGSTPTKSIYSVIFKRERHRTLMNEKQLFVKDKRGGATYYSLNNKDMVN